MGTTEQVANPSGANTIPPRIQGPPVFLPGGDGATICQQPPGRHIHATQPCNGVVQPTPTTTQAVRIGLSENYGSVAPDIVVDAGPSPDKVLENNNHIETVYQSDSVEGDIPVTDGIISELLSQSVSALVDCADIEETRDLLLEQCLRESTEHIARESLSAERQSQTNELLALDLTADIKVNTLHDNQSTIQSANVSHGRQDSLTPPSSSHSTPRPVLRRPRSVRKLSESSRDSNPQPSPTPSPQPPPRTRSTKRKSFTPRETSLESQSSVQSFVSSSRKELEFDSESRAGSDPTRDPQDIILSDHPNQPEIQTIVADKVQKSEEICAQELTDQFSVPPKPPPRLKKRKRLSQASQLCQSVDVNHSDSHEPVIRSHSLPDDSFVYQNCAFQPTEDKIEENTQLKSDLLSEIQTVLSEHSDENISVIQITGPSGDDTDLTVKYQDSLDVDIPSNPENIRSDLLKSQSSENLYVNIIQVGDQVDEVKTIEHEQDMDAMEKKNDLEKLRSQFFGKKSSRVEHNLEGDGINTTATSTLISLSSDYANQQPGVSDASSGVGSSSTLIQFSSGDQIVPNPDSDSLYGLIKRQKDGVSVLPDPVPAATNKSSIILDLDEHQNLQREFVVPEVVPVDVIPHPSTTTQSFTVPDGSSGPHGVTLPEVSLVPEVVTAAEIPLVPEPVILPDVHLMPEPIVLPEFPLVPEPFTPPEVPIVPEPVTLAEVPLVPQQIALPEATLVPEPITLPMMPFMPEPVTLPEVPLVPEPFTLPEEPVALHVLPQPINVLDKEPRKTSRIVLDLDNFSNQSELDCFTVNDNNNSAKESSTDRAIEQPALKSKILLDLDEIQIVPGSVVAHMEEANAPFGESLVHLGEPPAHLLGELPALQVEPPVHQGEPLAHLLIDTSVPELGQIDDQEGEHEVSDVLSPASPLSPSLAWGKAEDSDMSEGEDNFTATFVPGAEVPQEWPIAGAHEDEDENEDSGIVLMSYQQKTMSPDLLDFNGQGENTREKGQGQRLSVSGSQDSFDLLGSLTDSTDWDKMKLEVTGDMTSPDTGLHGVSVEQSTSDLLAGIPAPPGFNMNDNIMTSDLNDLDVLAGGDKVVLSSQAEKQVSSAAMMEDNNSGHGPSAHDLIGQFYSTDDSVKPLMKDDQSSLIIVTPDTSVPDTGPVERPQSITTDVAASRESLHLDLNRTATPSPEPKRLDPEHPDGDMDPLTGLRKTTPLSPIDKARLFMEGTELTYKVTKKDSDDSSTPLSPEQVALSLSLTHERHEIMDAVRMRTKRMDSWTGDTIEVDSNKSKSSSERKYEERKKRLEMEKRGELFVEKVEEDDLTPFERMMLEENVKSLFETASKFKLFTFYWGI